jgi:hypothetical protein
MEAREYFEKEYGHTHIEAVVEMKDWISLYGLMDEYAEWKVKNCSIPNVVGQSEQLKCQCKKAQFTRTVDADFNPLCGRCGKAL